MPIPVRGFAARESHNGPRLRLLVSSIGLWLTFPALGASGDEAPGRPAPEIVALACQGCHAFGSADDEDGPPALAPPWGRLVSTMQAFRNGERKGSVMNRIARGYDDADIQSLAGYLSKRQPARR